MKTKNILSNQKGMVPIWELLLIVAVIGALGFVGYRAYQARQTKPETTTQAETKKAVDPYEGWKSYSGALYSFKYPGDWKITDPGEGKTGYESVVQLGNNDGKVGIMMSPFQYPYGYTTEREAGEKISITIDGKEYSATEDHYPGGKDSVADIKIMIGGVEHHAKISSSTYRDFQDNKVTLIKILESLEIK